MKEFKDVSKETNEQNAENAYVEAFLEGNLRIPQFMLGMAIVLGNTSLQMGATIKALERGSLSPQNLARIKTAMNRAHKPQNVEYRSADTAEQDRHREVQDTRVNQLL